MFLVVVLLTYRFKVRAYKPSENCCYERRDIEPHLLRVWETFTLATTRVHFSQLATACVLVFPPSTLKTQTAPLLSSWDASVAIIPSDMVAASPQRLRQWTDDTCAMEGWNG